MIYRTIREWERIGYGDGDGLIPTKLADQIAAAARGSTLAGSGGEGVLEHGRTGLRARGVVGVIASGGCQLEILPKIESAGEPDVTDATLRQRLIHMLAIVHDLPIDAAPDAQLGQQNDTLLDLLIRLFCQRLADAVRRGIPRQYVTLEDELPVLRGRLDITRQLSRNAVAPQKLACRFDELSPDIPLNQVMRASVIHLLGLAKAPDNQQMLRELAFAYSEVSEVPVAGLRWDGIIPDRTNRHWYGLVSFARLLLAGRYQRTTMGAIDGYALLFEMNVLFEAYIARQLRRALACRDLQVSAQGGRKDCLYEGSSGLFQTRPDIIIRQGERIVMIIDTKWKRLAPRIDDLKRGVNQTDVYQMMAYSQIYHCPDVMLLYPHHSALSPNEISARYAIAEQQGKASLWITTLDITGTTPQHVEALVRMIDLSLPCAAFTV